MITKPAVTRSLPAQQETAVFISAARPPFVPASYMLVESQSLHHDLTIVCHEYKDTGQRILRRLITSLESKMDSWTDVETTRIEHLYTLEIDGDVEIYRISWVRAFEGIARKAKEFDCSMDEEIAAWFTTAITSRHTLRNWYVRLPGDDCRCAKINNHEHMLQTVIEAAQILVSTPG
jgi:hypothetical protein